MWHREEGGIGRAKHKRLATPCVRDATATAAAVCFVRVSDKCADPSREGDSSSCCILASLLPRSSRIFRTSRERALRRTGSGERGATSRFAKIGEVDGVGHRPRGSSGAVHRIPEGREAPPPGTAANRNSVGN